MIQLCICIVCCCLVANSWLTLSDHMDYSLPGSSVHGISQARILQWVAISFSYIYVAYIYILKLKFQDVGHLMQTADSLENSLMLGKIEGRRRTGRQRMRWLDGITDEMDMNMGKLLKWWGTGRPGMLQSIGLQRVGHDWAIEQQQQQQQYIYTIFFIFFSVMIYYKVLNIVLCAIE